jgi:hypothetical protein
MDKIQDVVALYQEAARLLHAQTDGLGTRCSLADSYMDRVTVYNKVLATLGDAPEQPPMNDVEWDATKFVQLRQAKAGLGLQRRVGGRESGRHGSSFFLCMDESDRTTVRAQEYNVTPTFEDLTSIPMSSNQTHDTHCTLPPSCLAHSDASTIRGSNQLHNPPRGAAVDEVVGLQSSAAGPSASGRATTIASGKPASSSRKLELMGELDKEFEQCRTPVQNEKAMPSIVLCKQALSSQLSSPRDARSDRIRSPRGSSPGGSSRGLSPGGYASKDAERQAKSRRALRAATSPRPPPSGVSAQERWPPNMPDQRLHGSIILANTDRVSFGRGNREPLPQFAIA